MGKRVLRLRFATLRTNGAIVQGFRNESANHPMLHNRISIFVNLPLASLDRLTLQWRLEDIGRQGKSGGA